MEMTNDFVVCFDNDVGLLIMELLNEPLDVVRAAAVSPSWRRFVIANGLCKKIFLKRFPHVAKIAYEIEGVLQIINLSDVLTVDGADWADLERDHRIYSSLLEPLAMPMDLQRDCLSFPLAASSAIGFEENLLNIMYSLDGYQGCPLFWSSAGQVDPDVPEYLTYKLCSDMCIVTEVHIRPYEASSEPESPVYAPKSVRFKLGYSRPLTGSYLKFCPAGNATFGSYNWTYTSPEFPMTQEAGVQKFKLPEAIVCVGGVVQIEMLGMAQMDPKDGLFYIRLGSVEIMGQSLYPAYVLDVLRSGELQVKFYPRVLEHMLRTFRFDPNELAHPNEETVARRPAVKDKAQLEEDIKLIEELLEEALSSTSASASTSTST